MTKRKKRILKEFRLDEISLVDNPAQKDARIVLMKRGDIVEDELLKQGKAALTSAEDGHTHLLVLKNRNGSEVLVGETSWVDGHTHPWVLSPEGVAIGEVNGHSHQVDTLSKTRNSAASTEPASTDKADVEVGKQADIGTVQGENMEPKNQETVDAVELQKKLDEAEARATRAEQITELNSTQRDYFTKLDTEGQDEFLGLDTSARDKVVAKALEDDKVVYETEDGEVFRKSDDPRLVALAKRADEERKARIQAEQIAKAQDLAKRAQEIQHLPGEDATRVALLKAVDTLEGEERDQVLELLKAHDDGLSKSFERKGARGQPEEGTPQAGIDKIAKKLRENDPKLTPEQAEVQALQTTEGRKFYADMVGL